MPAQLRGGAAAPDPAAYGLPPPLFQPLTAYAARGRIFPALARAEPRTRVWAISPGDQRFATVTSTPRRAAQPAVWHGQFHDLGDTGGAPLRKIGAHFAIRSSPSGNRAAYTERTPVDQSTVIRHCGCSSRTNIRSPDSS